MTRAQRLTRLEARRPPVPPVVIDTAPWEPPPGYFEEVLRILWAAGVYESIEAMASHQYGSTDPAVVDVLTCLLQETPPDAF